MNVNSEHKVFYLSGRRWMDVELCPPHGSPIISLSTKPIRDLKESIVLTVR